MSLGRNYWIENQFFKQPFAKDIKLIVEAEWPKKNKVNNENYLIFPALFWIE